VILEFDGASTLGFPRESVWRYLQDGEAMGACTPGATSVTVLGPGRYNVTCSVGSGLIRVHAALEAELHDLLHPERLRLRVTGTAPGSTLEVKTLVRLEEPAEGHTRLAWNSVTAVHGMLAGLGRDLVDHALRQFTEQFWENVATRFADQPRSGARQLDAPALLALAPDELTGAVLLRGLSIGGRRVTKGSLLGEQEVTALRAAAGEGKLEEPVRLAWIGAHELHEGEAADRLARASAGPGVLLRPGPQGRVDLVAHHPGVLTLHTGGIDAVNEVDPLELFTRWNFLPVEEGETVATVKVAPHVVEAFAVTEGVRRAAASAPLVDVRRYAGLTLAAVSTEPLDPEGRRRFEEASRLRAESLGGSFVGLREARESAVRDALEELALKRHVGVLLVGGVSAGDSLAPFFPALESLGGRVIRRGVPAHPGSMVWLARLAGTEILGLPRCGAFGMATAADLLLPRLMTGERLSPESLAPMGHGGMLGPAMRFRFPRYARDLPEPPGS